IAESLARPTLSERLVTNFQAHGERSHSEVKSRPPSWSAGAEYPTLDGVAALGAGHRTPSISDGAASRDDDWTATRTTNATTARPGGAGVWTGSEMIVWGGGDSSADVNTGGRYDPGTDSWTATSITNAPHARAGHTALWTGSEMIVWGGQVGSVFLSD